MDGEKTESPSFTLISLPYRETWETVTVNTEDSKLLNFLETNFSIHIFSLGERWSDESRNRILSAMKRDGAEERKENEKSHKEHKMPTLPSSASVPENSLGPTVTRIANSSSIFPCMTSRSLSFTVFLTYAQFSIYLFLLISPTIFLSHQAHSVWVSSLTTETWSRPRGDKEGFNANKWKAREMMEDREKC